ncbi:MAG: TIGR03668 family PPOX class F420-dependent oxidoreductase [Acidobacteria bacterium]|nr:TIGR03668 family PPOX class F420-dependent oxidoreductase [Acidobacteriota bacterium]
MDCLSTLAPDDLNLLEKARVGHLATASGTGGPSVVPICYVLHQGRIYSPVDAKPKSIPARQLLRIRHIRENPRVCFLVDHYEEAWTRLRYVMVRGRAALLEPGDVPPPVLPRLREKYPQYQRMSLEKFPMIGIDPERCTAWKGRGARGSRIEDRG